MHEMSIAVDLIATIEDVARQNGAARVNRALVEVGALSGVVPDALSFAFEIARKGTVANDCTLIIDEIPLWARCASCGWEGEIEPLNPLCPSCQQVSMEVLKGRDMRLVTIDIDEDMAEERGPSAPSRSGRPGSDRDLEPSLRRDEENEDA